MVTARVRVSTVLRNDYSSVVELKKVEGVESASVDYGFGSILVKLQGKDVKALDNILFSQIRKVRGIRSTSPLIID
jgi:hypothetical protein